MDADYLKELLGRVASGTTPVEEALNALRDLPYRDIGAARVDLHRALRQGIPEVILGEWKSAEQIIAIARELLRHRQSVMITRLAPEKAVAVCEALPELRYNPVARIASYEVSPPAPISGRLAVVTAGTADIPVAEEAAEVARLVGLQVARFFDCGVAGLHRLLDHREDLMRMDVIIAVAGMEGALPSVLGGLVACPVIAVPTSIGYGAHLGGLAPLSTMLTTCASGVVVCNIDNGFGAAVAAYRILAHSRN
ncbi:MAG: nickel pincer cofactor biosynthesis protein LarB [Myxococcales bacterium]|nr:nickel pincer cofactor biosynthesis protein LarB [Polyangiaceae bacterium]MDW8249201.1 nickel pincer cofactor biosynthesis protein LarB [Myxococcales bacterium]